MSALPGDLRDALEIHLRGEHCNPGGRRLEFDDGSWLQLSDMDEADDHAALRTHLEERGWCGASRLRWNAWDCERCDAALYVVEVDEGTTPFALRCKVDGCGGWAYSRFYPAGPLPEGTVVEWEWYRPSKAEARRLRKPMREHVAMGGLVLRRRGKAS